MTALGRPPRWSVAVVGVVAVVVVASLLPSISVGLPAAESGDEDETLYGFTWKAATNYTGPFAMSVRIEVTQYTRCDTGVTGYGTITNDNPVMFWGLRETDGGAGGSQGYRLWMHRGQVHVGSTVDTRTLFTTGGTWVAGAGGVSGFEDHMVLTIVAFDLGLSEDGSADTPLSVEVACDGPFRIAHWYEGDAGRSFTQGTLEGGTGATVRTTLWGPSVGFSDGDGLDETFDASRVRLQVDLPWRLYSKYWGEFTLRHPDGVDTWEVDEEGPPSIRHDFDSGPGDYELRLDWLGETDWPSTPLMGALVAMDPVDPADRV